MEAVLADVTCQILGRTIAAVFLRILLRSEWEMGWQLSICFFFLQISEFLFLFFIFFLFVVDFVIH